MAKRKNQNVEAEVVDTEAKVRKTKIDYIPEEFVDQFNELKNALAARKAEGKRGASSKYDKMTPEQLEAEQEKLKKKMAALNAALGL